MREVKTRERLAKLALRDWKAVYDDVSSQAQLSKDRTRKRAVNALSEAHAVLAKLAPLMRDDPRVPAVKLTTKNKAVWIGKITDLLAAGSLPSIAGLLDLYVGARSGSRPADTVIAQAANELAKISEATTGRPDWKWIAEKIGEFFDGRSPRSLESLAHSLRAKKISALRMRRRKLKPFKILPDLPPTGKPVKPAQARRNLDDVSALFQIRQNGKTR